MENMFCQSQNDLNKEMGQGYVNSIKILIKQPFYNSDNEFANNYSANLHFVSKKEESYDNFPTNDTQMQTSDHQMHQSKTSIHPHSIPELPSQSISSHSQVKFEEQRRVDSDQQNNSERLYNQYIQSKMEIQKKKRAKEQASRDHVSCKKYIKKKSGRPLKKNFAQAEKQKLMKEYDIEDAYGSAYSSENYQLLITALFIYGQDTNNGNLYIAKKANEGDKTLDFSEVISQQATIERKRMWLTYYKISRILNAASKQIMETLWIMFQQFIETTFLPGLQQKGNEIHQGDSMIQVLNPNLLKNLEDSNNIKNLFESSPLLKIINSDKGYCLFTNSCYDPLTQPQNQDQCQKKELRQLEYQEIERLLLSVNKFQKEDFIYILFSCAICDYFNILSPYYERLCNLL